MLVLAACSGKQTSRQEENSQPPENIQPKDQYDLAAEKDRTSETELAETELAETEIIDAVLKAATIDHLAENADSLVRDAGSAPSGSIKILRTGTFHADEIWEGVEKEIWFGLMYEEDGYVLREMEITAVRVVDELLDNIENGEKTGWEIQTSSGEEVILLFTNIAGLAARNAIHADVPGEIYPGDTVEFNFQGMSYTLFATGHDEVRNEVHHVSDYNLYFSMNSGQNAAPELLVSHPEFDDAMTSILWVGDIDGDGKPDMLIDRSHHYNVRAPALFLSSLAVDGALLQFAAEHRAVGC